MNHNIFYKNYLLYFISILMFILLIVQFTSYNRKEGFSTKDIDKIFNQTNNIMRIAERIPNQINSVSNEIKNAPKEIIKDVETSVTKKINNVEQVFTKKINNLENIFTNKIRSVLNQIGKIFMDGIINPILAVFVGIQTIFVEIFNILKKITDKIISLPSCMFTYLFKTTLDTIYAIYAAIIPKFIRSPISTIYSYTLAYPVNFISYHSGYDASVRKCYGFNVDKEVGNMNDKLNDINKSFKNDFGKLNFNKIKI